MSYRRPKENESNIANNSEKRNTQGAKAQGGSSAAVAKQVRSAMTSEQQGKGTNGAYEAQRRNQTNSNAQAQSGNAANSNAQMQSRNVASSNVYTQSGNAASSNAHTQSRSAVKGNVHAQGRSTANAQDRSTSDVNTQKHARKVVDVTAQMNGKGANPQAQERKSAGVNPQVQAGGNVNSVSRRQMEAGAHAASQARDGSSAYADSKGQAANSMNASGNAQRTNRANPDNQANAGKSAGTDSRAYEKDYANNKNNAYGIVETEKRHGSHGKHKELASDNQADKDKFDDYDEYEEYDDYDADGYDIEDGSRRGEKPKKSVGHKIFTIVGIVLCVIFIPIIVINCTLIVKQLTNKGEVPSVGGIFPMIVLTDSMKGTFDSGSLIICKSADAKDIKEGDIICFYDPSGNGTTTVTHRVIGIETESDGSLSFITKGDANNVQDSVSVPESKLLGVYKFHINGLGSLAMFMQTTPGLIIFVALPILIFIGYDMVRRRMYEKQKDDDTEALVAELEELRARKAAKEREIDRQNRG